MYSTYNEENSVVAERLIRTLINEIFKHMTAVSKNFYFDVLDNIVNKCIQNWSEEVFVVSKTKNTVPWTYLIIDLNGEPITRSFYEKELQKTSQ